MHKQISQGWIYLILCRDFGENERGGQKLNSNNPDMENVEENLGAHVLRKHCVNSYRRRQ